MKVSYIFSFTALAAALVLGSCAKENGATGTAADGTRTIAVSFAKPTKSVLGLDGLTPEFQRGDEIIISNGSKYEKAYIEFIDDRPVIKTSLTGTLTAVYPSSAAKLDGTQIIGVKVPMEQTGKFADANIAMAKNISDKAIFQNQTAVLKFYVDESIGVCSLEIRSEETPVADDGDGLCITVKSNSTLDNDTDEPTHRICYVAVRPGKFPKLSVFSYTKTQGTVQRNFNLVSLDAGNIANALIPYYITVNAGTAQEQKWAYCNIGALLPEEPGYYYSWGNTLGYKPIVYGEDDKNVDWYLPSGEPGPAGGFTEDNYSRTSGATLTGRLSAENDAATLAWGDKWRMPTKSELDILIAGTTWPFQWDEIYGKRGKYFVDKDGSKIFFTTTGDAYTDNLRYPRQEGHYWSSDCGTDNQACAMNYWNDPSTYEKLRYHGCPIRPIYGEPVVESNGLEVDKYEEGTAL